MPSDILKQFKDQKSIEENFLESIISSNWDPKGLVLQGTSWRCEIFLWSFQYFKHGFLPQENCWCLFREIFGFLHLKSPIFRILLLEKLEMNYYTSNQRFSPCIVKFRYIYKIVWPSKAIFRLVKRNLSFGKQLLKSGTKKRDFPK